METATVDESGDRSENATPNEPEPAAETAAPASAKSSPASPFPATSPADGSPLAPVTATDTAAIAAIVARAREAQKTWADLAVVERIAAIAKVKNRLLSRAEEIA